jgi:DNA-binding transcriptional ArsR family regulator
VTQTSTRLELSIRARFFRGLADLSRLAILEALRTGELTSGDVAAAAGLSPSNTSRHLACLKECGLVEARQDWRCVYYCLAEGVAELLTTSDAFIERVADRIAACQETYRKDRSDG